MKNPYEYSVLDLDVLLDTDPIAVLDLAVEYRRDSIEAQQIIFALVNTIIKNRSEVNTVIAQATDFLEKRDETS